MKILVKDQYVIIDGFEIEGWIDQAKSCPTCNQHLVYHERFDAYFCPKCNLWTEQQCSDPHCRYCPKRPERPL